MKKEKNINYFIGLDIGTNSVGWAVSNEDLSLSRTNRKEVIGFDENNNAIKKNVRRNLWGSRLFESAVSAKERRIFRSQRRRYDRRKYRINLLQRLLEPMVAEKDNLFFLRMKETFLQGEDRDLKLTFPYLFKESKNNKIYQKKYKSIYHLRKELIDNKEKADPRLVYLAIHHIIKYRGNFLYEGNEDFSINDLSEIQEKLNFVFEKINEEENVCKNYTDEIIDLLKDSGKRNKDKIDELKTITSKSKIAEQILKSILGQKFNFSVITSIDDVLKNENKTISFNENYEEHEEEYLSALDDVNQEIFLNLKALYDWNILYNLLGNNKYLSYAMVNKYNKHAEDLRKLKNFVKANCPEKYNEIFKEKSVKNNYLNYVATGHREDYSEKSLREDFYKYIIKIIEPFAKDEETEENKKIIVDANYFLGAIENNEFLNKLRFRDNGVLPYQLHKKELEMIIDNQGKYYPCLKENKEKIISLLTFRVPYYVGPLNNKSQFAWVERNYTDKITPWTFNDLVDTDESAEKFIIRMTNKCTYLPDEDVLPKNSIIYSKYCVLNELNKVKINNEIIDTETKNDFYENVFKIKATVKEKHLRDFLITKNFEGIDNKKGTISGYAGDKEFIANMKSYIDFTKILGEVNDSNIAMIEEIIRWITIFEDKEILKRKIKAKYGNNLNSDQIKKICNLKYTGWGSLSEKLINGLTYDNNGRKETILDIMYNTNKNFMQIINNEFKEILENEQKKYAKSDKVRYEDVANLHGSPAIKRGIWQALQIVDEIVEYMGCEPKKIFLEFAREEGEKVKTNSRYKQIEKKYNEITDSKDFQDVLNELKKYEKNKSALNEEKLYLYFIQGGKCMYTGKSLNIDELSLYQVDHIIPQSIIKDDSIENKALVLTSENQGKGDMDVLPPEIRGRMKIYWQKLYDNNLIGEKKYNNLLRNKFCEEDLGRFINRQIVETRQITKYVAQLLKQNYAKTQICCVKAELSYDFREAFGVYKIRDINDCHHAQDAYLSIVMGAYIQKVLPYMAEDVDYNDYNYKRENFKKLAKENEKYDKEEKENSERKSKYGFVIRSMNHSHSDKETGVTWNPETDKIKIIKVFNYKDYFITKKVEEDTGKFYNETLLPKGLGKLNIKKNLSCEKYGGYSGEKNAYISVVGYGIKNAKGKIKPVKEFIGVPIEIASLINNNKLTLEDYLYKLLSEHNKNIVDFKILIKKLCKYQFIKYEGNDFYIASDSEFQNAKQFFLDKKYVPILNYVINSENYSLGDKYSLILDISHNKEYFSSITEPFGEYKEIFVKMSKYKKVADILKEQNLEYDSFIVLMDQAIKYLLLDFINYYIEKINDNYKHSKYKTIYEKLNLYINSEKFKDLPVHNDEKSDIDNSKVKFVKELLKLTLAKAGCDNLKNFGFPERMTRLIFKVKDFDKLEIYTQSVTGLKETVYKL